MSIQEYGKIKIDLAQGFTKRRNGTKRFLSSWAKKQMALRVAAYIAKIGTIAYVSKEPVSSTLPNGERQFTHFKVHPPAIAVFLDGVKQYKPKGFKLKLA